MSSPIMTLYHVTRESNWPFISREGLVPGVGAISRMLTGASQRPRIYFFTSLSDAQWFKRAAKQFFVQADLMEPEEELIILAVDLAELKRRGIRVRKQDVLYHNIRQTKTEGSVTQPIPMELIKRLEG